LPADPQLPNLLIAGAMRSGTTSAYRYLEAHPDVFMSPSKEPHFLAFEGAPPTFTGPDDDHLNQRVCTSLEEYRTLFAPGAGARYRGEASAMYLYLPAALEGLKRHHIEPFVLLFLRDPADRAASAFEYLRRQGREPLETLAEALDAEPERRALGWAPMWHYLEAGRFAEQVTRWRDAVGADNLEVVLFEDLETSPQATFASIFERLGVDHDAAIDYVVHNRSGAPRSVAVERMTRRAGPKLRKLKRSLPRPARRAFERFREQNIVGRDDVDASTRARIVAEVADDVRRLEAIIDRDLSAWRR
jgi:hypothetical protein